MKVGKYEEQLWISRHGCINYNPDEEVDDDMVEMIWWGKFDYLKIIASVDKLTEWCEDNCEGLIYFNYHSYSFKFELEEDVMAFRLRWDE